jgi:hypothetical protein
MNNLDHAVSYSMEFFMKKYVLVLLKYVWNPAVAVIGAVGTAVGILTYLGIQPHKKVDAPTAITLPATTHAVPASTVAPAPKPKRPQSTVTQINQGKNGTNVGTVHGSVVINHGAPAQEEKPEPTPVATPKPAIEADKQISQINTGDNGTNIKTVDGNLRLNFNQTQEVK